MNTVVCEEMIKQKIEIISSIFKQKVDLEITILTKCFYQCFQHEFIKWALIIHKNHPKEFIDFTAKNAFTDAVLKLQEKASSGYLYDGNASIKTILFSFYRLTLLEHLQKAKRESHYHKKFINSLNNENHITASDTNDNEIHIKNLEKALDELDKADKQIIIWRHFDEKNLEEIASLLGIHKTSATNRLYRCMQRLRTALLQNTN
jgi:RNA polymerase sigma factor (sigma-70 family)